jgi:Fe-S-cluster containining protein
VSITGYDAWVIGTALHLPPESFLVYFPVTDRNDRGFLLEPGGSRYELALDKTGHFRKGQPCVFWVDLSNGSGRCGIYPYRPMVCQTYPAYQEQETVVLRNDVLCPEGAWNLAGMDLPVFRQRLYRFRMEQDIYAYIVGVWNDGVERERRTCSIREYFTALMNIYDTIHRWSDDLPREALHGLSARWGAMPPSTPNPLFADIAGPHDDDWRSSVAALRERIRSSAPWCAGPKELAAAV